VRALHLGSYAFKGATAVNLVTVTAASLAAREALVARDEPRVPKGRRLAERSGVADGAVAPLPDILPGLRDRFLDAAAAEGDAAAGGGEGVGADGEKGAAPKGRAAGGGGGYAAWLSQELARRRLVEGEGAAPPADPWAMRSFTISGSFKRFSASGDA
jgi:hypothetical protein